MKPRFFRSPAEFHSWLEKHHAARLGALGRPLEEELREERVAGS